ncbi:MAG: ABC transporter ATP-binding protein [Anaerolineae bacterium]
MEIALNQVHFAYPNGQAALQSVTWHIATGERVALMGANGSGKTTLARQLNGMLRPTQGQVAIGNWLTSQHSIAQLAHRVGYAFQNPDDQLCRRTVRDEVAFGARQLHLPQAQALTDAALAAWELEAHASTHPRDLSPAWRRRVVLAAVLAMNTPIVVFDEPTTGQDQRFLGRLATVLDTLHNQGKTVLVISHDAEFVADWFDRVVVLAAGRVVADGAPAHVLSDTRWGMAVPQLAELSLRLGWSEPLARTDQFMQRLRSGTASIALAETTSPRIEGTQQLDGSRGQW